ncbi:MAG: hypothetical protein J7J61_01760 [Candidatus Hydrothermae bacterium]|nr:hypothetical protein [Candidatus Hydrothermae bacterium]
MVSEQEILNHYKKVKNIIKSFGFDPLIPRAYRLGNRDFTGWYYKGRCFDLNRDYDKLKTCRTIYATLNFTTSDITRLPEYEDIVCMNLFADVDLTDDAKEEVKKRGRSEELKKVAVESIRFIYEQFCKLVSPESIILLDSGGGFYVMVHHRVTLPLAEFPREERGMVFRELCKRFNNFLRSVRERASREIHDFNKYFKIDLLNNKNRLFKVPMSVHKSLPVVVHPIDPENLDFDEMTIPIDDEKLKEIEEVLSRAPLPDQAERDLDRMVSVLFPEYSGGWRERLLKWIADEKKRKEEEQRRREEVIRELQERRRELENVEETTNIQDIFDAIQQVSMFEIVAPYITEDRGDGHPRFNPPYRPSKSGTSCFVINEHLFYDLAEHAHGDVIQFVALELGLIGSPTEYPKGKDWWKCVDELRKRGYKIPRLRIKPKKKPKFTLADRIEVESMPDDLPDADVISIVKPPRVGEKGGTYYAVKQMLKANSANYITHRHQGCEHAIEIMQKLDPEATAVVWIEGKYREGMCATGEWNCSECPLKPDEYNEESIGHFEMERVVSELLKKYKVLTKELINKLNREPWVLKNLVSTAALCPYYTLLYAEKQAKYCFTVAHFIDRITPRDLLIIDESPTVQYFYPRSVELFEVVAESGKYYSCHSILGTEYLPRLRGVKERIESKDRKSKEDKLILQIIEKFEEMNKVDLRGDIEVTIDDVDVEDKEAVLNRLAEYTHPDEYDPVALFEAYLYAYGRKLYWIRSENNRRKKLYLVGDQSKPIRYENVTAHKKVVVIGGIEGERFCKWLESKGAKVAYYEVTSFPYRENFIIFPINASQKRKSEEEKKDEPEWRKRQRRRENLAKVVKELRRKNIPVIVWTGTKEKQNVIADKLGDYAKRIREWSVREIKRNLHLILVAYANSRIARAVDVPFIDVCAIWDADFVSPYWHAVAEDAKAADDKELKSFAEVMYEEIIAEETTNMVLRISPVREYNENMPKIVLIPTDELHKIRWIEDRAVEGYMNMSLDAIIDWIDKLAVRRLKEEEIDQKKADVLKYVESDNSTKKGYSIEFGHITVTLKPSETSIWQKQVENGTLLNCLYLCTEENSIEGDSSLFEILKDTIIHVLKESNTRMSHDRLRRKVSKLVPVKGHEKIDRVMKRLCEMRIIKREKVGKKWMYSLFEG